MSYLQTSTNNPYGHRPWATRLYTGFENYGFLKQPQNKIIRGDQKMRPDIYKPPELKPAGMSGMLGRRRTLGFIMSPPAQFGVPHNFLMRVPYPMDGTVAPRPVTMLPPSITPPVPVQVAAGPGGIVYALPGTASVPGSPFAPPAPGELTLPPPAPSVTTSITDWLSAQDYVSGVPNGALAAIAAIVVFSMSSGKKRGR